MDRNLYNAASEGKVDVLRQHNIDQLEIQTTANRNTALHVASQFGQSQCVAAILEVCPSLLRQVNNRGETPVHMAAREGYSDIVKALIECAKKIEQELESGWSGEAKKMLRATNVDGDTALHMAVRNCHLEKEKDNYLEVVRLLTREDPEYEHPANNAEETPLYLAAERGFPGVAVLATLLETCTSPTYSGPGGRTALHAATLHDFEGLYFGTPLNGSTKKLYQGHGLHFRTPLKGSTKKLLEWKKDLIKQADAYGWIPLHYAACNKSGKGVVKELLAMDISMAYITTTNKDGLETALHIAAAHGHIEVMEVLLSYNPDCWEMVNSKGQNVLHIAVDMNKESVIEFILGQSWVRQLINQKDNNGNTPLHLFIASDCRVELWKHHRADRQAFNGENMTPNDLVWSNLKEERMSTFAATHIMDPIFRDMVIGGGRNIACNPRDNLAQLAQLAKCRRRVKRNAEEKKKVDAKNYREWFQTLMVVGALIATITFAAAFAIPGGYNGNQGRDQGMVVLERATAFQAFVITNTTAMMCSVISIFLCITGLWYAYREDDKINRRATGRYFGAVVLILVAMFAIMLAFIAATFAVLAHSIALALSTCIIACIPFIAYTVELGKFISRLFPEKTSSLY